MTSPCFQHVAKSPTTMGDGFTWRRAPYEYEPAATRPAINLLTGTAEFKQIVESKGDLRAWIATWDENFRRFLALREEFLIYQ